VCTSVYISMDGWLPTFLYYGIVLMFESILTRVEVSGSNLRVSFCVVSFFFSPSFEVFPRFSGCDRSPTAGTLDASTWNGLLVFGTLGIVWDMFM
jgi:hypothetical protein